MRELTITRREFEAKYPPKPQTSLKDLNHIEMVLHDNTQFKRFFKGFMNTDEADPNLTLINCNVILTNKNHSGIWLVESDDDIVLPGGPMCEDVVDEIWRDQPYSAICATIVRTLMEQGEVQDYTIPSLSYIHMIPYVLEQMGFTVLKTDFHFKYSYRLQNGEKDHIRIYMVIEVDQPKYYTIAFMDECRGHFHWYSKQTHAANMKTHPSMRKDLFGQKNRYDIRTDRSGLEILNTILSSEDLFGKLDIY